MLLLATKSRQSCPTVVLQHQAPPSLGFSRQEYWSGLPLPSPKFLYISIHIISALLGSPHPINNIGVELWVRSDNRDHRMLKE